jgi:hypothetical protein
MRRATEPVGTARASIAGAIVDGWRRTLRAPALVALLVAATLVVSVPLAAVLLGATEGSLGAFGLWTAQLGYFPHDVACALALETLELGPASVPVVVAASTAPASAPAIVLAAGCVLGWLSLSGGVLDRLARDRPLRTFAFAGACGEYGVRFLRLACLIGPLYGLLLGGVYPLVVAGWGAAGQPAATRAIGIALFLLALAGVGVVADVAKIRLVVEDRRSAFGAFLASLRFVRRRAAPLAVLAAANLALAAVALALWDSMLPSPTAPAWVAPVVLLLLAVRMLVRLAWLGAAIAYFQQSLAHAGYTAAPPRVWPESVSAEAIRNLRRR